MTFKPSPNDYRTAKWLTVGIMAYLLLFVAPRFAGSANIDLLSLAPAGLGIALVALLLTRLKRGQEDQGWRIVRGVAMGVAVALFGCGLAMVAFLVLVMVAFSAGGGYGSSK